MNNDWEKAIAFVLKEEGLYSNDPNDKGGETNFGISKRSYPNVDIKSLTVDKAKEIYIKDFWNVCHCDELPFPLSIAVFDSAVNQGVGAASRMLQIALNVTVDGVIGPKTIAAAFKSEFVGVRRFLTQRMVRYIDTIAKDPTQRVFAENWAGRLIRLTQLCFSND